MKRARSLGWILSRLSMALIGLAIVLVVTSTRASAPAGRYTVAGNGTVLDTKTGLTWQQTVPAAMTQTAALAYCASLSLAGTGWRLPTAFELQTLVDYSQSGGTVAVIDPTAFPSTPAEFFWSATPVAGASGEAWIVAFGNGDVNNVDVTFDDDVRCVR